MIKLKPKTKAAAWYMLIIKCFLLPYLPYPNRFEKRLLTIGIANRAMNLMQRLVQEINIAEAFASANNKNLN
jgi:hypothetical protein